MNSEPGAMTIAIAPKISVSDVRREYRDPSGAPILALDGLDLAIAEGEFICILGPSGCGKSTLLRLLAGLEQPSAGTAAIHHEADSRPAQAMVFQGQSLLPWRTILDFSGSSRPTWRSSSEP